MLERLVPVSDIREEVDLVLVRKERSADGVHGCVAPALVEELAGVVERGEELHVRVRAEEVEVADLEVTPDWGHIESRGVRHSE